MPGDLIQTPQTRWILGAYESVRNPTPIVLVANVTSVAGNDRWTTFRPQFGTTGYSVTPGKTLYLTHITLSSSVAGSYFRLLYGDTDVGSDSVTPPTNPRQYMAGLGQNHVPWATPSAEVTYTHNVLIAVPATKYLTVCPSNAGVSARFSLIGHEE